MFLNIGAVKKLYHKWKNLQKIILNRKTEKMAIHGGTP